MLAAFYQRFHTWRHQSIQAPSVHQADGTDLEAGA